jgi:peptide/nickel transport system permease protein
MIAFLLRRLVGLATVLLAVVTVTFGLIHLSGDPVDALAPPGASPADRANLAARYGLDDSLIQQYVTFMGNALRGDFGDSWRQDRPALDAVMERLPATLALLGSALAIAIAVGIALGVASVLFPNRLVTGAVNLVALAGQAIPAFWLGTVLILIVAVRWRLLPASGLDGAGSLILPAVTLALHPLALVTRLLRASLRETMGQDFIRTARSKGLREGRIILGHAARNSLLPVLSYLGLQASFLIGGSVVVESVFAWPGLGSLTYDAATARDLPIIQASVTVIAILIVLIHLAVDVIARLVDPRLATAVTRSASRALVQA